MEDRLRRAVEPDRQLKMLQSGREIVGLGQLARHDRGDPEELLSRFGPGVQERSLEFGHGRGRALGRQDEPAQQDGGAQMVGLVLKHSRDTPLGLVQLLQLDQENRFPQ